MGGSAGCSVRSFYCLPLPDSTRCFPYGGSSISFLQEPVRYFAQGVFRELIHCDEINGNLVRTELPGGILTQSLCQLWTPGAVRDDVGHHLFAIDGIGPTDDSGLANGRIAFKHLFDLAWCNVFASSDNDIAQATRDKEVALLVLIAEVACTKPAVLKGFFVLVAIVGGNDAGATDANL